jgi:hypothetical protein
MEQVAADSGDTGCETMGTASQPADLHGGAAELRQIERADVVQQLRCAGVMGPGERRGGAGKPWGG